MQTPTAFFGFAPGSDRHIIHWDKLCAYYRMLAAEHGREAVELTGGDREAVGELANAWGSYIPDWNALSTFTIDCISLIRRTNPSDSTILSGSTT